MRLAYRTALLSLLLLVWPAASAASAAADPGPVRARLTWDAAAADIDLHVFADGGGHGWYRAPGGVTGLRLSADVRAGPGAEILAGAGPASRAVAFGACWYAAPGAPSAAPVSVSVALVGDDGRTTVRRVVLARPGDGVIVAGSGGIVPPRWCGGTVGEKPVGGPDPMALARRFRPRLRFDASERWRPLAVEPFVRERRDGRAAHAVCAAAAPLDRHPSRCAPGSAVAVGGLTALLAHRAPTEVIDVNGDGRTTAAADAISPVAGCRGGGLVDCDRGDRSAIYARTFALGGYTVLDYWLLYRFNDAPYSTPLVRLLDNDHEGDWEGVSVGAPTADPVRFDWVAFAGHGAPPRRYLRGLLVCDAGGAGSAADAGGSADAGASCSAPGAGRPRVYVAAGTHASYPLPCRDRGGSVFGLPAGVGGLAARYLIGCHQRDVASPGPDGALPEGSFDGARPWGADDDAQALRPLPADSFTTWPGRWGLPGSVRSPAFQFANRAEGAVAAAQARATTSAATTCDDWLAEAVAVLVCDQPQLDAAFAAGQLGRPGTVALTSSAPAARPAASAPGVAQLGGGPLAPGERAVVGGAVGTGGELVVRAIGAAGPVESRVALGSVPGPLTITVDGPEQATITVTTAAGRRLAPSSTRRPPARPRRLRVRRRGGRAWIAFRATTDRALVTLLDGRGRVLSTRVARTRAGGAVRMWVALPGRPRGARPARGARWVVVRAVRGGMPGGAVRRRVPARVIRWPVLSLSPEPAQSGRPDLNRRPPRPKRGALPG